ncbi:MAG: xanthine dehydrogenase family protein subunit M [Acidimicrobiia bacterium]|nr:xanthine dehydrogenase family protein subunit M [Acidimicrobiia bacterium]
MKPASFDYYAARSVAEAVALLKEHGDEGKVLAGGQSLVPAMNFRLARPEVLIDVNPVAELDYIEETEGILRIGSLVRHMKLEHREVHDPLGRLLKTAARHVGHMPIRVRGTFGGSLAHADPAAEWCVISALLDGEMIAQSSEGQRSIPAKDFFQTVFTTDLRTTELLSETRLPVLPATSKVGFTEFSRRAGDFALTMAAVVLDLHDGKVDTARIALGGISDRPIRAVETERGLHGREVGEALSAEIGESTADEVEPMGDIHGSAEYRRDLVRVLTKRAVDQAISG